MKSLASEADAISFDLEDAVAPESKPAARAELARFLAGDGSRAHGKLIIVRVNAAETGYFAEDVQAVVLPSLHILNLPMVDGPAPVRHVAELLDRLERERGIARPIGILANIESPRGLRLAAEIATAHRRVIGLQIGFGDLFSPLGIAPGEPSAMQAVRVAVRMAAGEAGIEAFDGASVNIADLEGFRREAAAAQQLGFSGKSCIHPSQIAAANEVFRPSAAEVARAVRVVAAAKVSLAKGVGAFVVDGRLVDGPFITQAEHMVALARRLGMIS
jgi:citrate lyase subunit beta/citryl-CoA lyase